MDILSIFFNMKVCCAFSLESPHRGDSNEYTQYTIFYIKKENHPKFSQIRSHLIFSNVLKIELERARVNEPSGFEPLKFCCIYQFKTCINTKLADSEFASHAE